MHTRHAFATLFTVSIVSLVSAGCVNGKLSPVVAPIVASVDQTLCDAVPPDAKVGPIGDEALCKAASSLLNTFLTSVSAQEPKGATIGGSAPAQPTEKVLYRGVALATLRASRAAALRTALTDPAFAAQVDAALGVKGGK